MRLRPLSTADDGITLVELMVVMLLLSVVSAMLTTAVISTSQSLRHDEDEARGLADVRKVVERLSRDIRDARQVDAGADGSQLVLWVDYDSNYARAADASEDVTWQLQAAGSGDGHFDVVRTQGAGGASQATTLVDDIAFRYDALADGTTLSAEQAKAVRLVTVSMRYDALIAQSAGERTVTFSSRLRNVS